MWKMIWETGLPAAWPCTVSLSRDGPLLCQCLGVPSTSPLVSLLILTGGRNRMVAFCVFKAFGETLHTRREGTRFNYLKTLLPHSASGCGKTSQICGTLGLVSCLLWRHTSLWSQHLGSNGEKESSMHCLYKSAVSSPKPSLLYRSLTSALSDFFIIFLYFYMYSVIDFC